MWKIVSAILFGRQSEKASWSLPFQYKYTVNKKNTVKHFYVVTIYTLWQGFLKGPLPIKKARCGQDVYHSEDELQCCTVVPLQ